MPIADTEGYDEGHFTQVYENIIKKSCENAGYQPIRADEVRETNLIHLDILKKLIEAPIAICDLSSRNPNVLFELGIRQAFDKPVVLIQEEGTPRIFDIAPLRYLSYSKDMKYHDVLSTQQELEEAIIATANAESDASNVNSIVKLLALNSAAQLPDLGNNKEFLAIDVLHAEMREMRKMFESTMMNSKRSSQMKDFSRIDYERISQQVSRINMGFKKGMHSEKNMKELHILMQEVDEILSFCKEEREYHAFKRLAERIHRTINEM